MKQLHVTTREEWREWLAENHGKEEAGIWLVFYWMTFPATSASSR